MNVTITDRQKNLTPETTELAKRRLAFALSRFASRIEGVSLTVSDANGPRGGVDKICQVNVYLHRLPDVRLVSKHERIEPCLASAADRVGRAVARTIKRSQSMDRSLQRAAATPQHDGGLVV